jgi:hypothetical protein
MNRFLVSLPLLVSFACVAQKGPVPAPSTTPFQPTLTIRPTAVAVAPGTTQAFQAEINYPEGIRPLRQPITWDVIEPGGGTITPTGVYTAPLHAGTYHVEARREDFPALRVAALVVVQ